MTAPIRQQIPLPVGSERHIQLCKAAEQDRDQVTPSVDGWPVELHQAGHNRISRGCCMLTGLPVPQCPAVTRPGRKSPSWPNAAIPFDGRFKPRDGTRQVAGGSGDARPGGNV
jgi:hypothetical protein